MHTTLACGDTLPRLGQGTWHVGDDPSRRADEIDALRQGIDLGLTLIDTAEMYGDGRAERLVGEAIAGRRAELFLVSKVLPHNASRHAMQRACEASLRRLGVDTLDLYLLHWSGAVPLAETVQAFEALQRAGKIRHWGVSNLDTEAMQALWDTPGGQAVQTNQVLYHLDERGPEWDLLPWQRARGLPLMAYSPFDEGRLLRHAGLRALAEALGRTPAQLALGWLLAQPDVVAIPKSGQAARVAENAAALHAPLPSDVLMALEAMFAPPQGPTPLAMI